MVKKIQPVDFSDSYISIILGFLVVLVGGILLYNFFTKSKTPAPAKNIAQNVQVSVTSDPALGKGITPTLTVIPSKVPTTTPTRVPSPTITKTPTRVPTRASSPTLIATRVPSKSSTPTSKPSTQTPTKTPQKETGSPKLPATYTVRPSDTLWSIAEKFYSSGYNWVDIAKENKITNPQMLAVGTTLRIPNAEVILPKNIASLKGTSKGEILPTAVSAPKSYVVQKGDTLWGIAVKVYADGFAWPKIAQANHLVNPRLIHPGNKFVIP